MKNKKLLAILGLTALAANLGYSSLVLAQTVTGTQTIGCGTATAAFVPGAAPTNFSFASVGVPAQNYTFAVINDTNQTLQIQANSQTGCTNTIALTVQALQRFEATGSIPLKSSVGDVYPILSLALATYVDSSSTYVQHWNTGTETRLNDLQHGVSNVATTNAFTGGTTDTPKYLGQATADLVLLDEKGCKVTDTLAPCDGANNHAKVVTLFYFPDGFFAQGDGNYITFVTRYGIALPRYVSTGAYSSTLLWTLSAA